MKKFIEETASIIAIASNSLDGNKRLVDYLSDLMTELGLHVEKQMVPHSFEEISKQQFNLIGILGDPLIDRKTKKGLLLLSHLDSAGPGQLGYWTETQGNPYVLHQKEDQLFGLGVVDSKLDFLCKLFAMQRIKEKKLNKPVYLVGTCGTELGMFGAKYLIQSGALNPEVVLVGAPTDLKLSHGSKGSNLYKVTLDFRTAQKDPKGFNRRVNLYTNGRLSHSAYPDSGLNAIYLLLEFIQKTIDSGFDVKLSQLTGGSGYYCVPDYAKAEFGLTSYQFEDFKRFFKESTEQEGWDTLFNIELGGVGEQGVFFLPEETLNCVNEVISFFKRIVHDLEKSWDQSFDPPVSTVSLCRAVRKTGSLELYFDVRLLPNLNQSEVDTIFKNGLMEIVSKFTQFNLKITKERSIPGYLDSSDNVWLGECKKALEDIGVQPRMDKVSFHTESSLYFTKDYPVVAFGPGLAKDNLHAPNENVLLSQLQQAVSFYEKIIERVCL